MFTGIITDVGRIAALERREGLTRVAVESAYDPASVQIGASIAHDGCCLTVVALEPLAQGMRHWVEAAAETLAVTTLSAWSEGRRVNLERALRVGDELGGHVVSGHVDGVGRLIERASDGEGVRMRFSAPAVILPLIAQKGSIAIDGVSLTVNTVDDEGFGVLIIPHTLSATTLDTLSEGDNVNLEADMLARYAQRLMTYKAGA